MSGVTVLWVDVETVEGLAPQLNVVADAFAAALAGVDHQVIEGTDAVLAACCVSAVEAVEAAVVGQWAVQRHEPPAGVKVRIGIHHAPAANRALAVAERLCGVANGNQIVASGAVDTATGGTLDARPMGAADLDDDDGPIAVWLMTDSRPDVDRRPLRLPGAEAG